MAYRRAVKDLADQAGCAPEMFGLGHPVPWPPTANKAVESEWARIKMT